MIVAGIGFRRLCPAADIVAAVRAAEALAGRAATRLAVPAFKSVPKEAAAALALPVSLVDDAAMQAVQPRCVTRSVRAARATGFASVAEAAALAVADRLIQPRVAHGGATCALAETP